MSITPQDVPHLVDPSPGNRRIRPQEIGRIVQVLNAHRRPTTVVAQAPVDTTRDCRETTGGASLRPAPPSNPLPASRTRPGCASFQGADAGMSGPADVSVREPIARLAALKDAIRTTPAITDVGASAALSEDLVGLRARMRDSNCELRCAARTGNRSTSMSLSRHPGATVGTGRGRVVRPAATVRGGQR